MEGKVCEFIKKEDLVERAKVRIYVCFKNMQRRKKEFEALGKKTGLTKKEASQYIKLRDILANLRDELSTLVVTIVILDIMEEEEMEEYLASLVEGEKNGE